jgi:hypothetical protein
VFIMKEMVLVWWWNDFERPLLTQIPVAARTVMTQQHWCGCRTSNILLAGTFIDRISLREDGKPSAIKSSNDPILVKKLIPLISKMHLGKETCNGDSFLSRLSDQLLIDSSLCNTYEFFRGMEIIHNNKSVDATNAGGTNLVASTGNSYHWHTAIPVERAVKSRPSSAATPDKILAGRTSLASPRLLPSRTSRKNPFDTTYLTFSAEVHIFWISHFLPDPILLQLPCLLNSEILRFSFVLI